MQHMSDYSSSVSREQVAEAYLKVIRLIDDRVTPFLGKVTTRVLVQGAARRILEDEFHLEHWRATQVALRL